jgi:hypothetical protein
MFIQNYAFVQNKELYMNGVNDESADSICAVALTILEYLNIKEDKTK